MTTAPIPNPPKRHPRPSIQAFGLAGIDETTPLVRAILDAEALVLEAEGAILDAYRCRTEKGAPLIAGLDAGALWKEALIADAETFYTDRKLPKVSRVGRLISTDAERVAFAEAVVGAAAIAQAAVVAKRSAPEPWAAASAAEATAYAEVATLAEEAWRVIALGVGTGTPREVADRLEVALATWRTVLGVGTYLAGMANRQSYAAGLPDAFGHARVVASGLVFPSGRVGGFCVAVRQLIAPQGAIIENADGLVLPDLASYDRADGTPEQREIVRAAVEARRGRRATSTLAAGGPTGPSRKVGV